MMLCVVCVSRARGVTPCYYFLGCDLLCVCVCVCVCVRFVVIWQMPPLPALKPFSTFQEN